MTLVHPQYMLLRTLTIQPAATATARGTSQPFLPHILSSPCSRHPGSIAHPPPTQAPDTAADPPSWDRPLRLFSGCTPALCQTPFWVCPGVAQRASPCQRCWLTSTPAPTLTLTVRPCLSPPNSVHVIHPDRTPSTKILGGLLWLYRPSTQLLLL